MSAMTDDFDDMHLVTDAELSDALARSEPRGDWSFDDLVKTAQYWQWRFVGEREVSDRWRERTHAAEVIVERVVEAVGRHPEPCTDTPFSCGWKSAVLNVRAALAEQVQQS